MEDLVALIITGIVILTILRLFGNLLFPRQMWYWREAHKYKHPENVEPSGWVFFGSRVKALVVLALIIFVLGIISAGMGY